MKILELPPLRSAPETDAWILSHRPPRNPVSPDRPYAWLLESENAGAGRVVDVATLFLTNRECPFRCLMCDLWKNTLETRIEPGKIAEQIRWGLSKLPAGQHLKLYNSGNFFDPAAIPPEDYPAIAQIAAAFERLIVECHPRLVGRRCQEFRRSVACDLEIAMGLETVHPEVLPRLNKQMTLDDFASATRRLRDDGVSVRAFILIRPPFLSDEEGEEWARKSIDFAFSVGVECCSLIPTRSGNGVMEKLAHNQQFAPPSLEASERTFEYGLSLNAGRVFLDLWDIEKLKGADSRRIARLRKMNLNQTIEHATA